MNRSTIYVMANSWETTEYSVIILVLDQLEFGFPWGCLCLTLIHVHKLFLCSKGLQTFRCKRFHSFWNYFILEEQKVNYKRGVNPVNSGLCFLTFEFVLYLLDQIAVQNMLKEYMLTKQFVAVRVLGNCFKTINLARMTKIIQDVSSCPKNYISNTVLETTPLLKGPFVI